MFLAVLILSLQCITLIECMLLKMLAVKLIRLINVQSNIKLHENCYRYKTCSYCLRARGEMLTARRWDITSSVAVLNSCPVTRPVTGINTVS